MTDLEITKLCAEAIGLEPLHCESDYVANKHSCDGGCYWIRGDRNPNSGYAEYKYDPLHDDAQAMALVKKLRLHVVPEEEDDGERKRWDVFGQCGASSVCGENADLNRAICECVAKMRAAKAKR